MVAQNCHKQRSYNYGRDYEPYQKYCSIKCNNVKTNKGEFYVGGAIQNISLKQTFLKNNKILNYIFVHISLNSGIAAFKFSNKSIDKILLLNKCCYKTDVFKNTCIFLAHSALQHLLFFFFFIHFLNEQGMLLLEVR